MADGLEPETRSYVPPGAPRCPYWNAIEDPVTDVCHLCVESVPVLATACSGLRTPERTQVDGWVARLPALEEALDRRMDDDPIQLVERE